MVMDMYEFFLTASIHKSKVHATFKPELKCFLRTKVRFSWPFQTRESTLRLTVVGLANSSSIVTRPMLLDPMSSVVWMSALRPNPLKDSNGCMLVRNSRPPLPSSFPFLAL